MSTTPAGGRQLPLYQVDAFADRLFAGNPAAVVVLQDESCPAVWPTDVLMQQIAAENNVAETAFLLPDSSTVNKPPSFGIRWFTPTMEVDLCGHATLASAYVVTTILYPGASMVVFTSPRTGRLPVVAAGGGLTLDFPADTSVREPLEHEVSRAIGAPVGEVYRGREDLMCVVSDEQTVAALSPDLRLVSELPARGLCVTAPGSTCDFVSRFFAPQSGIPEDPVTGSAHTALAPYWAEKLGRSTLDARQLSPRGGALRCVVRRNRVLITGTAVLYLTGTVSLSE